MRCSIGRATQKYKGATGGADFSDILEAPGDLIYADQNIDAENLPIGTTTGHVLTVIAPGQMDWQAVSGAPGSVGTLQTVTDAGPTTTNRVDFLNTVTSLTASGNVLVTGNVTAQKFYGDGTSLSGLALKSDLLDNSARISAIESCQTGDILYASAPNTLSKLSIGAAGQVLKSDGTIPVWGTDLNTGSGGTSSVWTETGVNGIIHYSDGNVGLGTDSPISTLHVVGTVRATSFVGDGSGLTGIISSLWNDDNGKLYYTNGPVGIGNVEPLTTQTLQIGGNVSVGDTLNDKISVTGNVYISRNLRVIDDVDTNRVLTNLVLIKKQVVTAERPKTTSVMII